MSWMQTRSGKKFSFVWPIDPDSIDIEDIAEHLSKLSRYVGATIGDPYSVAQHSILVSAMVPSEFALEGLMHDAAEAYLGDVSRPLKQILGETYKTLEKRTEQVIAAKYRLHWEWPAVVHQVDLKILATEYRDLMEHIPIWDELFGITPYQSMPRIIPWSWEKARDMFLERFHYLSRRRKSKPSELDHDSGF